MRIINSSGLREKGIPFSLPHIWRLEKVQKFPRRIKLGENRIGWVEAEIDEWLAAKIAERDREAEAAGGADATSR